MDELFKITYKLYLIYFMH